MIKCSTETSGVVRDHTLKWLSLFQASCLNFDKTICKLFGEKLSLQNELAFALQFAKLNVEQISTLQEYEVPEHIKALDARLNEGLTDEQFSDLEYQFKVIYTLDSSSKGQAHLQFVHPDSAEAEQIRNVLVTHKIADEIYPHKPGKVTKAVAERSGKRFTSRNHTQAVKKYRIRPPSNAVQPENTNKEFCIYHAAHKDYTYSEKWVEFLIDIISTPEGYESIKSFRLAPQGVR